MLHAIRALQSTVLVPRTYDTSFTQGTSIVELYVVQVPETLVHSKTTHICIRLWYYMHGL